MISKRFWAPFAVVGLSAVAVAGPAKCFRLVFLGGGCTIAPPDLNPNECLAEIQDETDINGFEETSSEGRTVVQCSSTEVCQAIVGQWVQGQCVPYSGGTVTVTSTTATCELSGPICNEGEGEI